MADDIRWRKASRSGNGGCVEAAYTPGGRSAGLLRDSRRPQDGYLATNAFAAFIADVKLGRYDLPRLLIRPARPGHTEQPR